LSPARRPVWPRSDESDENDKIRDPPEPRFVIHERKRQSSSYDRYDRGSPPPKRQRSRSPGPSVPSRATELQRNSNSNVSDRAARLAAMASNASAMSQERRERLNALLEREKAEVAADDAARARSKGMGNFLSQEQKKVFGGSGGLE